MLLYDVRIAKVRDIMMTYCKERYMENVPEDHAHIHSTQK